jgi:hypothetical protein
VWSGHSCPLREVRREVQREVRSTTPLVFKRERSDVHRQADRRSSRRGQKGRALSEAPADPKPRLARSPPPPAPKTNPWPTGPTQNNAGQSNAIRANRSRSNSKSNGRSSNAGRIDVSASTPESQSPNNSLSRLVCARLTGISVCFLSSMRSWYELLNQGTTSRMRLIFTR